jgi:thymidylate synthase (FAD)
MYLRADRHAQYEIRVYADVIYDIVKQWVPVAAEAFEEYRLHGAHLSKTMVTMVQKLWRGEPVDQATSGLSAREWDDFMAVVEP